MAHGAYENTRSDSGDPRVVTTREIVRCVESQNLSRTDEWESAFPQGISKMGALSSLGHLLQSKGMNDKEWNAGEDRAEPAQALQPLNANILGKGNCIYLPFRCLLSTVCGSAGRSVVSLIIMIFELCVKFPLQLCL